MKRSWKKPLLIHVTFGDSFSNNLYASFEVGTCAECVHLDVDLASNFRTRNRSENSYVDVCQLAASASSLTLIQFERDVWDSLKAEAQKHPNKLRRLNLLFGSRGTFRYSIQHAKAAGDSVLVDVSAGA